MNLVPTWSTPITFVREDRDLLVTYGLVSTELVEPDPGAEFGRLHALGDLLPTASRALARRGKEDLLSDPKLWVRVEEQADLLEPLRAFRDLIAPAAKLVTAAADGHGRQDFEAVSPASRLLVNDTQTIADLMGNYGPRLAVERFSAAGRELWGLHLETLIERTVVELFDLFTHRPRLRRCMLCDRVFVPRGNEANCRWHLWAWPLVIGARPLEVCNEEKRFVIEAAEGQAHRREYVRLHTRFRRARERYEETVETFGARSRKAREARDALQAAESEYESLERRRRGLKPRLDADAKDLQRKEEDDG